VAALAPARGRVETRGTRRPVTSSAAVRVKGMQMELTDTQVKILEGWASGHSGRQVARAVGLSEATMRRMLAEARELLGAGNTTQAVYIACKRGLI
jgi:DNA-binding NarL/FixJ family response regulator